jgi:hypothetical protein
MPEQESLRTIIMFKVAKKIKALFDPPIWKKEWKEQLSVQLKETQQGLKANFVAVIIRESDLYSELLFLLSFLGLSAGLVIALFMENKVARPTDLLLFPVLGFCVGTTIFHLKRFYLKKVAAKAVKFRVSQKAKSLFYEHQHHHKGPLLFLFFSELEREAVLLASKDVLPALPQQKIKERLAIFSKVYKSKDPLKSFTPLLNDLASWLKLALGSSSLKAILDENSPAPLYFISSGSKEDPIPVAVLKGNKDIN